MPSSARPGCLGQLLSLFGIRPSGGAAKSAELPFRLRDDFLSQGERAIYMVLVRAVAGQAVICPKVNLSDIFFVARPSEHQGLRNKIDRKHVDFLLCDPRTLQPLCAIELDDSSHQRRDRQDRDAFVDQVFQGAGLVLFHIPARPSYVETELAAQLAPHLSSASNGARSNAPPRAAQVSEAADRASAKTKSSGKLDSPPLCPKCGVAMVRRVSTKGPTAGQAFFGCPNYPKCREIQPA